MRSSFCSSSSSSRCGRARFDGLQVPSVTTTNPRSLRRRGTTHTNHTPPPLAHTHSHTWKPGFSAGLQTITKNKILKSQHCLSLTTATTKGRETAVFPTLFLRRHSLELPPTTVPKSRSRDTINIRNVPTVLCIKLLKRLGSKKASHTRVPTERTEKSERVALVLCGQTQTAAVALLVNKNQLRDRLPDRRHWARSQIYGTFRQRRSAAATTLCGTHSTRQFIRRAFFCLCACLQKWYDGE